MNKTKHFSFNKLNISFIIMIYYYLEVDFQIAIIIFKISNRIKYNCKILYPYKPFKMIEIQSTKTTFQPNVS